MNIHGACHCGNIAFDLEWPGEPAEIPARACDCSFCVKHGGVWTSLPTARLRVRIARPGHENRYRFGTRTATFHLCAECGVPPLATCEIDGVVHAVVNTNTFDAAARRLLKPVPISYEGEETGARLERRRQRWIGDVRFD